jgi:hypothetical protein
MKNTNPAMIVSTVALILAIVAYGLSIYTAAESKKEAPIPRCRIVLEGQGL